MRRALGIAVAAGVLAALPATANAATSWRGVVVAKDLSRKALIVAGDKGLVRTIRAPGKVSTLRLGQLLAVRARALEDGTFAARAVRAIGRAKRARVRGVVVSYERRSRAYLVSAGGSVFAFRAGGLRSVAAANATLEPGDRVLLDLALRQGGELVARDVVEMGQEDGSFMLRSVEYVEGEMDWADGEGEWDDADEQELIDVEGTVTDVKPSSIMVRAHDGDEEVSCSAPADVDLSDFLVGDEVEMACTRTDDGLALVLLSSEYAVLVVKRESAAGADEGAYVEEDDLVEQPEPDPAPSD